MATITIYTDASLCPQTCAGGWAAWLRREDRRELVGAAFRTRIGDDCNVAEMAAAANGVAASISLGMAHKDDLLIVVTDSQAVVRALFDDPEAPSNPRYGRMVTEARRLVQANELRVKVNKVKGHSQTDGARSHVNGLVDKLSRKHMRAARALLAPPLDEAIGPAVAVPPPPPTYARIGVPPAAGALYLAASLWQQGIMTRVAVREAVVQVAAHQRRHSPDDWASACLRLCLIASGDPAADWGSTVVQAHAIDPNAFATAAMKEGYDPAHFRTLLAQGVIGGTPEGLALAEPHVTRALIKGGHCGLQFRAPSGDVIRVEMDEMFYLELPLPPGPDVPSAVPGMR